ncbi:MAG: MBL fold metallo-hydrolase [Thermodesulfobacteriota bacterium]
MKYQGIEIIGTESLGVRGLSCVVRTHGRIIMIDPGVALGYVRHGLMPHPRQVAQGVQVRRRILAALGEATDVVFSHYHGDHIPLKHANPYQLSIDDLPSGFAHVRCWAKGTDDLNERMRQRALDLARVCGDNWINAEGREADILSFSPPVPHGSRDTHLGSVMMTRIELDNGVFAHASDIQLLDSESIYILLAWAPDTVLAAGPPLYLEQLTDENRSHAWDNALRLAAEVDTLILDHHLLRSAEGERWLASLCAAAGKRVLCAADYMGTRRLLFESRREEMYQNQPVAQDWHERYAAGEVDLID